MQLGFHCTLTLKQETNESAWSSCWGKWPLVHLPSASWGISALCWAVHAAPCARHKSFPARPLLQARSNFDVVGISIHSVWQAEPWHAEASRNEGQAIPFVSQCSGEQGARCHIQENKAIYREDPCLQPRKALEHMINIQHVCSWLYETKLQRFLGFWMCKQ